MNERVRRHKVLKLFAVAVVAMSWGCQQSVLEPAEQYSSLCVSVTMPESGNAVASRSSASRMGYSANRLVVELYDAAQDTLCNRYVVPVIDKSATLEVNIRHGQKYNALFWADSAAVGMQDLYYNTAGGLKQVTVIADMVGNDNARDAFYASASDVAYTGDGTRLTVVLKRPFAQLNFMTTDIRELLSTELSTGLIPKKVKVQYTAAQQFNVESGEIDSYRLFEFAKNLYDSCYCECGSTLIPGTTWSDTITRVGQTLAMDFLLAPQSVKEISQLQMIVTDALGHSVTRSYSNIPFQRNCRTNIIGPLVTCSGSFKVSMDTCFFGNVDEYVRQ